MVNDQEPGMTDAGTAEMSGSGQGEGPAGMRTEQQAFSRTFGRPRPSGSIRCIFRCGEAG